MEEEKKSEWKTAECKNCYRKLGVKKEIILSKSGTWVHNNPIKYELKCHVWEPYVAEPWEDSQK